MKRSSKISSVAGMRSQLPQESRTKTTKALLCSLSKLRAWRSSCNLAVEELRDQIQRRLQNRGHLSRRMVELRACIATREGGTKRRTGRRRMSQWRRAHQLRKGRRSIYQITRPYQEQEQLGQQYSQIKRAPAQILDPSRCQEEEVDSTWIILAWAAQPSISCRAQTAGRPVEEVSPVSSMGNVLEMPQTLIQHIQHPTQAASCKNQIQNLRVLPCTRIWQTMQLPLQKHSRSLHNWRRSHPRRERRRRRLGRAL